MASRLSPHFDPTPFWGVVEDCLVQLHGLGRREAQRRVKLRQAEISAAPPGIDAEIIYHVEEFDVACSLAGRQLDRAEYAEMYEQIAAGRYAAVLPGRLAL